MVVAVWHTLLVSLYLVLLTATALLSLQALAFSILYLHSFRRPPHRKLRRPPPPAEWPTVTVQLPIFNEPLVVERLLDAVSRLAYPAHRLTIQVLDDSNDGTTCRLRRMVDSYRARGIAMEILHRRRREGFKAGALAYGLRRAPGELIAVFDADFVPHSNFLLRLVPHLSNDDSIGMVQARWGHLNAGTNPLTRCQALSLDGHFVVIQRARFWGELLVTFDGSAGIWRRSCIEDAGGWQHDTLTEDLDLSYRAQLHGWRMVYVDEVMANAEIPPQLAAYKRQQYRWVHGGIRSLLKLGWSIWTSRRSALQRLAALFHLASYLSHPLLLFYLLLTVPLSLSPQLELPSLRWIIPLGIGPLLLVVFSQWRLYPDWRNRLAYLPLLVLLSVGIALNNSLAVFSALGRRSEVFRRTPKFNLTGSAYGAFDADRCSSGERIAWGEILLSGYALVSLSLAWHRRPEVVPTLIVMVLGFGFVGLLGSWPALVWRKDGPVARPSTHDYHHEEQ